MSQYTFPFGSLKEITDSQKFEQLITDKGTYSKEKNKEIYHKFFKKGPRSRLYNVIKRYGLDRENVLDVGCSYGHVLAHLGPGSYGVDYQKEFTDFAVSIGLQAYHCDATVGDLSTFPKVDNAIAWAVMEHVDSQHLFLRNLHSVIKPGGRLFLYVPTIPSYIPSFLPKRIRKYWEGHKHGDHVNAYSYRTLRFIYERAGFETISCNPGFMVLQLG